MIRLLLLRRFDIQIGVFFSNTQNISYRTCLLCHCVQIGMWYSHCVCMHDCLFMSVCKFCHTTSVYSQMVLVRAFAINNNRYTNIIHGRVRNAAGGEEEVASKIGNSCMLNWFAYVEIVCMFCNSKISPHKPVSKFIDLGFILFHAFLITRRKKPNNLKITVTHDGICRKIY